MKEAQAADEPGPAPTEPSSHPRRRRWWWMVGGGLAVLAVALMLRGPTSGSRMGAASGNRRAPDLRLNRLDDPTRQLSLSDFRGRPLVLNFWASWCGPCRKEMPGFESVASQLRDRVAFLGVNEQDVRSGAVDLVATTGVRYPSVVDSDGVLKTAYGLRGLPDTIFISSAGEVVELHVGELSATDLRETIRRSFKI